MISLLIGTLVLIAIVYGLRWYANADVKKLRRSLQWTGIGLLALGVIALVVTGRISAALAGLAALVAWAFRLMSMVHMGRQLGGMFRGFGFGGGFGRGGQQTSQVDSIFVRMTLNHDSGAMDGDVLEGRFQGKRLGQLSREDLLALLAEAQADADSVSLIEAYLDRTQPDWREASGAGEGQRDATPTTAMTADEAYRILGLKPDATDADIKAAYRRLMAQLHPDHGGTDYLAAKVNQAKDFLLKKPPI